MKFLRGLALFIGEVLAGAFWCFVIITISVTCWLLVYAILTWPMKG